MPMELNDGQKLAQVHNFTLVKKISANKHRHTSEPLLKAVSSEIYKNESRFKHEGYNVSGEEFGLHVHAGCIPRPDYPELDKYIGTEVPMFLTRLNFLSFPTSSNSLSTIETEKSYNAETIKKEMKAKELKEMKAITSLNTFKKNPNYINIPSEKYVATAYKMYLEEKHPFWPYFFCEDDARKEYLNQSKNEREKYIKMARERNTKLRVIVPNSANLPPWPPTEIKQTSHIISHKFQDDKEPSMSTFKKIKPLKKEKQDPSLMTIINAINSRQEEANERKSDDNKLKGEKFRQGVFDETNSDTKRAQKRTVMDNKMNDMVYMPKWSLLNMDNYIMEIPKQTQSSSSRTSSDLNEVTEIPSAYYKPNDLYQFEIRSIEDENEQFDSVSNDTLIKSFNYEAPHKIDAVYNLRFKATSSGKVVPPIEKQQKLPGYIQDPLMINAMHSEVILFQNIALKKILYKKKFGELPVILIANTIPKQKVWKESTHKAFRKFLIKYMEFNVKVPVHILVHQATIQWNAMTQQQRQKYFREQNY